MIKIAVLGYGIVGSGVVELIDKNNALFTKKTGDALEVKYILDIRDFPGDKYSDKHIKDFDIILNDPEVSIVAETIGGVKIAYEYTKKALLAGKSVVSSNKELVAMKAPELLKIAKEMNVNYLFEASVGGGIPILRPLYHCLSANELHKVVGILNGTTNYILTKMAKENIAFDVALSQAQTLGYAEKDPSADINGLDSCRKICILASLSFGRHIYPQNVYTKGIQNISINDLKLADEEGFVVKLLGFAEKTDDSNINIFVSPCAIKKDHALAAIDDVFNGISVSGDAIGDVTFYGRGAGKFPTASAVGADIIECAKNNLNTGIFWVDDGDSFVKSSDFLNFAYLKGTDIPILK